MGTRTRLPEPVPVHGYGRHIGLLWFAVSRRRRLRPRPRPRLYHFVDKIPGELLGLGLSVLHI